MDTDGFTTTNSSLTISYAAPEILEQSLSDNDDGSEETSSKITTKENANGDGSEETSKPPKLTSKEADIYAFAILTAEVCVRLEYRLHLIQFNLDPHGGNLLSSSGQ